MIFELLSNVMESLMNVVLNVQFLAVLLVLVSAKWALSRPRQEAPQGRTVLITGCDTGMGNRMARRFDELGMRVFAGCLNPLGNGAHGLRASCSPKLHIIPLDITKDDQVKQAVTYVKEHLSPEDKGLHCLINNAGVLPYAELELMTTQMIEEALSINLMGAIRVTKHFLPLIQRASGRIVSITSILARLVLPRMSIYAASKHALNGFFSALRFELMDQGIHVATVEPGDFSTTTDIFQWMQRHLDDIWNNFSDEEKKSKLQLYKKTKERLFKKKLSLDQQEQNYGFLLRDVEDAMLAEQPQWRYVSAPLVVRIFLWIVRQLPERMAFRIEKRMTSK